MLFKKRTPAEAIASAADTADTVVVSALRNGEGSVAIKGTYESVIRGLRACMIETARRFPEATMEDIIEDIMESGDSVASKDMISDIRALRVSIRMRDGRIIGKGLTEAQARAVIAVLGIRTGADGRFTYIDDEEIKRLMQPG